MRTRTLLAFLVGSLGAALFAPLSADALSFDVLKIVDLNGNVLTDLDGNPTIATLEESQFPGGTASVSFELTVPDIVPISTAGAVHLIEQAPNPVTQAAPISDDVFAQLLSSGATFPALLVVQLRAHTAPRPVEVCQQIGLFTCILETGGFQDVTAALFPGRELSFRVLVQSDPTPVPEPGTLLMLGLGLAGLAASGRREGSGGPRAHSSNRQTV